MKGWHQLTSTGVGKGQGRLADGDSFASPRPAVLLGPRRLQTAGFDDAGALDCALRRTACLPACLPACRKTVITGGAAQAAANASKRSIKLCATGKNSACQRLPQEQEPAG